LLGHITIGAGIVRDKIAAIPGFPPRLATLVEHLILSHHGSYEFGSPSLPQIPEAVALHFCDDLDSKMGAMRATMGEPSEGARLEVWTDRNPALRRAILRAKLFLENAGEAEAAERTAVAAPVQKSLLDT
jgi:3'-5' exoribonuclease